jgi:hypothetical protein
MLVGGETVGGLLTPFGDIGMLGCTVVRRVCSAPIEFVDVNPPPIFDCFFNGL